MDLWSALKCPFSPLLTWVDTTLGTSHGVWRGILVNDCKAKCDDWDHGWLSVRLLLVVSGRGRLNLPPPPPSHHVSAFVWQNGWALEADSLGIDIRLDRPQFCAFVYISERAWWFLCQGYCQCESQILDGHFHCTHLTPINQSVLSPSVTTLQNLMPVYNAHCILLCLAVRFLWNLKYRCKKYTLLFITGHYIKWWEMVHCIAGSINLGDSDSCVIIISELWQYDPLSTPLDPYYWQNCCG